MFFVLHKKKTYEEGKIHPAFRHFTRETIVIEHLLSFVIVFTLKTKMLRRESNYSQTSIAQISLGPWNFILTTT